VPLHPVIDQTIHRTPLDAGAAIAYAAVFIAIVVLAVRRPAWGLATMIVLVPFAFYRDVGTTTVTLSKVALLANAAALAIGRRDVRVLRRPAAALLIGCAAFVCFATALSIWHAAYRGPALRETLKSLEYLALFIVALVAATSDPDQRPIRIAFAASCALVSVLALTQEFVGAPSGIWFAGHPIPRIAGPLEGPNQLAGYLGISLAVVLAYALRTRPTRYELGVLVLASAALVLTISRTGLEASLAGLAVVVVVGDRSSRRVTLLAIGAGCAMGAAVLAVWGFLATHSIGGIDLLAYFTTATEAIAPGSVGNRSELWHAAFVLWRTQPFFGIGAGNFELELGLAGYPGLRTHANSLYLQALAEGGVPLFLATLALVTASIARFARGPFSEPLVAAAFGASIGFAAHQVFDLLVFYPKVGELWWIVLALAAARYDARTAPIAPA
jgi:O-antigen ligase